MKNFIKNLSLYFLFIIFILTNYILISVSVNSCKKPEDYINNKKNQNISHTTTAPLEQQTE